MAKAEFDDGKEDGALRTIGEVAKALSIKAHVLRYWEQQFPQLKPLKRSGGRRYYRPKDIAVVERINRLVNDEGYTLKGAKSALKAEPDDQTKPQASAAIDVPVMPSAAMNQRADNVGVPAEVITQLKSIRASLAAALER